MTIYNKMSQYKQTYKIHRWDAVLLGKNTDPRPIIYVKPDESLLKFARENKNALLVNIQDSEGVYDDKHIIGIFTKSSDIPNYRPNFFNKTDLYVIVLTSDWHGYPNSLGNCQILRMTRDLPTNNNTADHDSIKTHKNTVEPLSDKIIEKYKPKSNGMDSSRIIAVSVGLGVLLVSVLFICKKNK